MFAKIRNNQVVEFPYNWDQLLVENPSTVFDKRFSLIDWYAKTEAAQDGSELVEVVRESPMPSIDWATETADRSETPQLVGDTWKLLWVKRNKTEEEISDTNLPVYIS